MDSLPSYDFSKDTLEQWWFTICTTQMSSLGGLRLLSEGNSIVAKWINAKSKNQETPDSCFWLFSKSNSSTAKSPQNTHLSSTNCKLPSFKCFPWEVVAGELLASCTFICPKTMLWSNARTILENKDTSTTHTLYRAPNCFDFKFVPFLDDSRL